VETEEGYAQRPSRRKRQVMQSPVKEQHRFPKKVTEGVMDW